MKKTGYTLAEILIALSIIGILAAIFTPMANRYKPDTRKILYLKTYDAITSSLGIIANNEIIYPPKDMEGKYNYTLVPFFNLDAVNFKGDDISGGKSKLCNALKLAMEKEDGAVACSNNYLGLNNFSYETFANQYNFRTTHGIPILVTTRMDQDPEPANYLTEIYFDINGTSKGDNCMFSAACTKPDVFKIWVAADGSLIPADAKGAYYLETRTNWNYKKDGEYASLDEDLQKFNNKIADLKPKNEEEDAEEDAEEGLTCGAKYNGKIINCIDFSASTSTMGDVIFTATAPVLSNVGKIKGSNSFIMPKGKQTNTMHFDTISGSHAMSSGCKGGALKSPRSLNISFNNAFEEDSKYIYVIFPIEPIDFKFKKTIHGTDEFLFFTWGTQSLNSDPYRAAVWIWHGYGKFSELSDKQGKETHYEDLYCTNQ